MPNSYLTQSRLFLAVLFLALTMIGSVSAVATPLKEAQLKIGDPVPAKIKSVKKETKAVKFFKQIYKRDPDLKNANDSAFVEIVAYKLLPKKRNPKAEKEATKKFKAIFKRNPKTAQDRAILTALTYINVSLATPPPGPSYTARAPIPTPVTSSPPSSGDCVNPPSGLVAWFPAEGNAREVVNGRHGAISTGISFAEGKVGQAFSFDADGSFNDVRMIDPGSYELDLTGSFTVEAWVKFLEEPESGWARIITKPSVINFTVGDSLEGSVTASGGFPSSVSVGNFDYPEASALRNYEQPAQVWTHVALTFDGRTLRSYRNGDLEIADHFDRDITLNQNDFPFSLGTDVQTSAPPYLLDEVRVYNRALSETELERIYSDGSSPRCIPPETIPAACVAPPAGQVAWFTGDDTLTDLVSGLTGEFSRYGTYGPGVVGNAFTKTENSNATQSENMFRVIDPGTADFSLDLTSFTVEGWVNFIELDGSIRPGTFVSKSGNYKLDSHTPYARIEGLSLSTTPSNALLAPNQWHHLANTYDGRRLNLYVNGALASYRDASGTAVTPAPVNNERLSVGFYTLGSIDEISFYNRALDRREIDQIYRAASVGKCRPAG